MDLIKLGDPGTGNNNSNDSQKSADTSTPAPIVNTPNNNSGEIKIKPENHADISINFTPKIPNLDKPATSEAKKPELLSLEVKKTDLSKIDSKPDFFNSSSLQEKAGGNSIMENITSQKLKINQPQIGDLLGKQSKILEKTIEQETLLNYTKRLRVVQFIAFFVFLVALGVNSFLYFQLSPGVNFANIFSYNFDSNLRHDLFNVNESLRSVQTELNTYRFLTGQLYLNQFGYETTRFMDAVNSSNNNVSNMAEREKIINDTKVEIPQLLKGAKDNLSKPLVVETFTTRGEEQKDEETILMEFQKNLKASIMAVKKSVLDAKADGGMNASNSETLFYDNSVKMVGNKKLLTNLQSTNIDTFLNQLETYSSDNFDPVQRDSFKKSIDNLLESTKVNLATITNLRNARREWSGVLERIEAITNKVNVENNIGNNSGNNSEITYSGMDFNAETGKISISGINTTTFGTNRDVVTYLMEAFEDSPEFKNATNRSFPLNKAEDTSGNNVYTMNFKIDMEIENGSFSKLNAPIVNLNNTTTEKTAVKRK